MAGQRPQRRASSDRVVLALLAVLTIFSKWRGCSHSSFRLGDHSDRIATCIGAQDGATITYGDAGVSVEEGDAKEEICRATRLREPAISAIGCTQDRPAASHY